LGLRGTSRHLRWTSMARRREYAHAHACSFLFLSCCMSPLPATCPRPWIPFTYLSATPLPLRRYCCCFLTVYVLTHINDSVFRFLHAHDVHTYIPSSLLHLHPIPIRLSLFISVPVQFLSESPRSIHATPAHLIFVFVFVFFFGMTSTVFLCKNRLTAFEILLRASLHVHSNLTYSSLPSPPSTKPRHFTYV